MSHRSLKSTVGVFMVGADCGVRPAGNVAGQALTRTVYVAVTDKARRADYRHACGRVRSSKYAGKTAAISDVKIATTPVRVALLIADRGTGIFQAGTLQFVNALLKQRRVFDYRCRRAAGALCRLFQ